MRSPSAWWRWATRLAICRPRAPANGCRRAGVPRRVAVAQRQLHLLQARFGHGFRHAPPAEQLQYAALNAICKLHHCCHRGRHRGRHRTTSARQSRRRGRRWRRCGERRMRRRAAVIADRPHRCGHLCHPPGGGDVRRQGVKGVGRRGGGAGRGEGEKVQGQPTRGSL